MEMSQSSGYFHFTIKQLIKKLKFNNKIITTKIIIKLQDYSE